jgi:hypothetical protein
MSRHPQKSAQALPDQLAAEIAGLQPFASHDAAVAAINNGIRARYVSRLSAYSRQGRLSELFVQNIGAAINNQCDRAVASVAPIGCHLTGWTSHPVSSLKNSN